MNFTNTYRRWLKKIGITTKAELVEIEENRLHMEKVNEAAETIRKILLEYVEERTLVLNGRECHIEVGDICTLNIFEFNLQCKNSWDKGPEIYISQVGKIESPVLVEITDVEVNKTLAIERIDRYFNQYLSDERMLYIADRHPVIIRSNYENFCKERYDRRNSPHTPIGLYKEAKFQGDFDFKPQWGLNVNSFLKAGTKEYNDTIRLWKMKIELESKANTDEYNILKERYNNESKELYNIYRENSDLVLNMAHAMG